MRIAVALALALSLAVVLPYFPGGKTAEAHPLGNNTINRLLLVDIYDGEIRLRYVLDLAEIPAFQEIRRIDLDGDNIISVLESAPYLERKLPEITANLELEVDGKPVQIALIGSNLTFQDGEAGLKTMRLVADYRGELPDGWQDGVETTVRDNNYKDRLGWQQVVVQAGGRVVLSQSSAPDVDETEQLTIYPPGKSPPNVSEASFGFQLDPAASPATPSVTLPGETKAGRSTDGFTALISRERLTPAFIGFALLAAFAWGAAHALGPGHGKTIVAAYLVGSSATPSHVVLLGLMVTITHTSSVIAVGLLALFATSLFPTDDLYVWLSISSGLMVVAFGACLLASRMRTALRNDSPAGTHNHHEHSNQSSEGHHHDDQDHDHGHSHTMPATSWRGLIALGVSGGILPCPTALVVMLGAIALDRIAYGFVLILAFSLGLAGVLTGVGLILLYARRFLNDRGYRLGFMAWPAFQWTMRTAPVLSALVITLAGLFITGQAISSLN